MLKRVNKTYIVSDLHFGHSNIIKYCNRPYKVSGSNSNPENKPALEQMEKDILAMFDELPPGSDIWNLGDIFFTTKLFGETMNEKVDHMLKLVQHMSRDDKHLYLILGNHDEWVDENSNKCDFYRKLGFESVYDTPIILEDKWILSHEPVYITPGSNFINLYGHTHDLCIEEDYFTYDYENYAMQMRVYDAHKMEKPVLEKRYPEKIIELKNYKNCCLDHTKGILEWSGDYFSLAATCWKTQE